MICAKCGTDNPDSAGFCSQCGSGLAADAGATTVVQPVYAGFWLRVGATLIDQVILTAAYFVLLLVLAFGVIGFGTRQPDPASLGLVFLFWILSIVGPWLYSAMLESSRRQATVGKLACGIKVTDLNGERISFGRATGRHFAEWITGLTFLIGYVMVAFTQRRQALHDLIAGTVVVSKAAAAPQVAGAAPAQRLSGWAIAAIVAAASVFPLGILAAIAIPAYQDYTIRAQITEGLVIASDYKAAVVDYLNETGDWPVDDAAAGYEEWADSAMRDAAYVRQVQISDGTITVTYGKQANSQIARKRLSLRPWIDENGDVAWQCGNSEPPAVSYANSAGAYGGGTESAAGRTNLPDKYMPARCRTGYLTGSEP